MSEHDLQKASLKGCGRALMVIFALGFFVCALLNIGVEQGWWK